MLAFIVSFRGALVGVTFMYVLSMLNKPISIRTPPLQITIVVSLSVTISMYCLIQMYVAVADILRPQKPLLKLFAIKAVGMFELFAAVRLDD